MLSSIPTGTPVKKLQMVSDQWLLQVCSCCRMRFTVIEGQAEGHSWRALRGGVSIVITISYRRREAEWFNCTGGVTKRSAEKGQLAGSLAGSRIRLLHGNDIVRVVGRRRPDDPAQKAGSDVPAVSVVGHHSD